MYPRANLPFSKSSLFNAARSVERRRGRWNAFSIDLEPGRPGLGAGLLIAVAEYALWEPARGYGLPLRFLPLLALLTASWIGLGWALAGCVFHALPDSLRASNPRPLFVLLTMVGLVASWRLDYGT